MMPVQLPIEELLFETFRSSGPGGQNVNKVETAVRLRWDLAATSAIPADARVRLAALAGRRMTREGVLLLEGRRYRTQEQNRADLLVRLAELVGQALVAPKPRRKSKPGKRAKERRLRDKKVRSETKRGRSGRAIDE